MSINTVTYPINGSGQNLILTSQALQIFAKYQQISWHSREAGGQLFARFECGNVIIEEATKPSRLDIRRRCSFRPRRRREQREIYARHKLGLHFVGDWHTHPEPIPAASQQDNQSMAEIVNLSTHQLNAFVMVIVGTEKFPEGLQVSLCYKDSHHPYMLTLVPNKVAEL